MAGRDQKTVVTVISKMDELQAIKQACLVMIYGLDLGKNYKLERPSLIIGRSSKCDIQLDQESVSRNHAKLINEDDTVIIRDLSSIKGTFVNDEPVEQAELNNGDVVKIGRTIFRFLCGGNIENAYHDEIFRLTTVDGLTQVYNKRFFLESLDREISRSRRYGRHLSLVLSNVDNFRHINDNYGHLAGDHLLKKLAELIKSNIRRDDFLARYGGEEFAIMLPETDHNNAAIMANKVRHLVGQHKFTFNEATIPITISAGVAMANESVNEPLDLIKLVDHTLYQAKKRGRNCVVG